MIGGGVARLRQWAEAVRFLSAGSLYALERTARASLGETWKAPAGSWVMVGEGYRQGPPLGRELEPDVQTQDSRGS